MSSPIDITINDPHNFDGGDFNYDIASVCQGRWLDKVVVRHMCDMKITALLHLSAHIVQVLLYAIDSSLAEQFEMQLNIV